MKAQVETITPVIAQRYLSTMSPNRRISPWHLAKLQRAMVNGEWTLNGETIKFDIEGRLRDGQHRLTACIKANVAIQCLVVRDVPESAFRTINTARVRSHNDFLRMAGYSNTSSLAPALGLLWQHDNNEKLLGIATPSANELDLIMEKHPMIHHAVSQCLKASHSGPTCFYAYVYCRAKECDYTDVDDFINAVATGANLPPGNPALTLRERMGRRNIRTAGIDRKTQLAFIIKAYNAWHDRKPMRILKWNEQTEEFPVLCTEYNFEPTEVLS